MSRQDPFHRKRTKKFFVRDPESRPLINDHFVVEGANQQTYLHAIKMVEHTFMNNCSSSPAPPPRLPLFFRSSPPPHPPSFHVPTPHPHTSTPPSAHSHTESDGQWKSVTNRCPGNHSQVIVPSTTANLTLFHRRTLGNN